MSKVPLSVLVSFYNLLGISSLKPDVYGWKNSSILAMFHVLKMPLVIVFTVCMINSRIIRNLTYKLNFDEFKSQTPFSKLLIIISVEMVHISSLSICFLEFSRRKRIEKFINKMCEVTIDDSHAEKLKTRWKNHFRFISSLFLIIALSQFFTKMKFTVFGFISWIILIYPHMMMSSFLSFVKSFEIFFIILLRDFQSEFENGFKTLALDLQTYQRLLNKYQEIYEVNRDFLEVFGTQLTLMTCCVTGITTLQVI